MVDFWIELLGEIFGAVLEAFANMFVSKSLGKKKDAGEKKRYRKYTRLR